MAKSRARKPPSTDDPLAEPTTGRRIWAAYMKLGYSRAHFADAIGCTLQTVYAWENGACPLKLDNLVAVSRLVGYSLDELVYGHHVPRRARDEVALTLDEIGALMVELRASDAMVEAFAAYTRTPAGQHATLTRSYVAAFVEQLGAALDDGAELAEALTKATRAAVNARALASATAARLTPTTAEALAAVGAKLKRARKRRRSARRR